MGKGAVCPLYINRKRSRAAAAVAVAALRVGITIFLCAAEVALAPPLVGASEAGLTALDVTEIAVSPELGYLLENHPPATPSQPVVIHIQEAHTNYDAQRHIVHILEQLIRDYGLRLILVEGGSGDAGLAYLRNYGPKENRLKVGEKYLKAGVITAEEYLDIVSDHPLTIWGVDDDALHDQHVEAFLAAEPLEPSVARASAALRGAVQALAPRLLAPRLIELNQAVEAFDAQRLDLAGYVDVVATAAEGVGVALSSYPQVSQMLTLRELETSIDRQQVAKEHAAVVSKLAEVLDGPTLDALLAKAREMKAGTLSKDAYYTHLKDLASRSNLSLADYSQLSRYLQYVTDRPVVDSLALSHELSRLVGAARAALAATPESRQLQTIAEAVDLLEKFAAFRLTPEEYQRLTALDLEHAPDAWIAFLGGQLLAHGLPVRSLEDVARLKPIVPPLERFYHIATQRDDALVANTLAKLTDSGEHLAVLITGGFHSDRITRALRAQGLGVAVIAPKITQPTDERLYHAVLKYKNGHGQLSDVLAITNQPTTTSR